ncbi:hypothetical protein DL764_009706 [Monosporascus ibericus]|uniref:Uncharacterized protein n=1 Tax=Monosporascus ibericus TaxID=155417 RepID=A0A4V1X8W7_9PEZI|nr:hypothetical protein DL764_009706 [Monosporascus ibericus]
MRDRTSNSVLAQYGDIADEGAPMCIYLIKFIPSCLDVDMGAHNLATDACGLDGFVQRCATNTRNLRAGLSLEPFDSTILDRSQLTYLDPLPNAERMAELDRRVKYIKLLDAAPEPPPADFNMPGTSEVLFHLPKSKVAALKTRVSPCLKLPPPTDYIGKVVMHGQPELTFSEIVAPGAFPRPAALMHASNVEVDDVPYRAAAEWVAGVPDKRRIGLH